MNVHEQLLPDILFAKLIPVLAITACFAFFPACSTSTSATGNSPTSVESASNAATAQSTQSKPSTSSKTSESENITKNEASAAVDGKSNPTDETIDPHYVGDWIGHDIYTMQDMTNTYNLHDNGDWATLVVNEDGAASLDGDVAGSSLSLSNLHLERGTVEYLLCEADGSLVGSLGYNRAGTTDWLILSIPEEEVGMVCYTFFINDRP